MIVTATKGNINPKVYPLKQGTKASYYGSIYEVGKYLLKGFGYYQDIEPYLPDRYIEKYTYKPHKRLAGEVGKKIHKKKRTRKHHQFTQKECHRFSKYFNNSCK